MPPSVKPPSSSSEVEVEDQEGEALVARRCLPPGGAAGGETPRASGRRTARSAPTASGRRGSARAASPTPNSPRRSPGADRARRRAPAAADRPIWRDRRAPCPPVTLPSDARRPRPRRAPCRPRRSRRRSAAI